MDEFSEKSKKRDRPGSIQDVANLTAVFKKLYFEVDLWDNKRKDVSMIYHAKNLFINILLGYQMSMIRDMLLLARLILNIFK